MTPAAGHATPRRFVLVGSVIADLVLTVPAPPRTGDDLLADSSSTTAGGGFNVLAAVRRQGMAAAYAGRIGRGPFGDRIADALDDEGIDTLIAGRAAAGDSGVCVVMVDAGGERTMVTSVGVDAHLSAEELTALTIRDEDLVYVSGYDLVYPHGPELVAWLSERPPATEIVVDPGPLAGEIPAPLLSAVLDRATWLSLNLREAQTLTGAADATAATAAAALRRTTPRLRAVVVREGADGCLLHTAGATEQVPAVPTALVDATGAGDCHVGVFCAAVARGLSPSEACRLANAAAAIAVSRRGPATAPTRAETEALAARTTG